MEAEMNLLKKFLFKSKKKSETKTDTPGNIEEGQAKASALA